MQRLDTVFIFDSFKNSISKVTKSSLERTNPLNNSLWSSIGQQILSKWLLLVMLWRREINLMGTAIFWCYAAWQLALFAMRFVTLSSHDQMPRSIAVHRCTKEGRLGWLVVIQYMSHGRSSCLALSPLAYNNCGIKHICELFIHWHIKTG